MDTETIGSSVQISDSYTITRLRVFVVVFASCVVLIALSTVLQYRIQRHWEQVLRQEITRNLTEKAQMFSSRINSDHSRPLAVIASEDGQAAGARATIIDGAGKVLADSQNPVAAVENEGQRPEFVAALRGTVGVENRQTNNIPVLYVAAPVPGGAVRLAYPMSDLEIASAESRQKLLLISICELLGAGLISTLAVRLILRR